MRKQKGSGRLMILTTLPLAETSPWPQTTSLGCLTIFLLVANRLPHVHYNTMTRLAVAVLAASAVMSAQAFARKFFRA